MELPSESLVLTFDGSCWPNPGGPVAYGWQLRQLSDGKLLAEDNAEVATSLPHTNNTAEFYGLVSGLQFIKAADGLLPRGRLLIRGDSQLVIRGLRPRKKGFKKTHLAFLCQSALTLIRRIGRGWEANWIPREQNSEADTLSKAA